MSEKGTQQSLAITAATLNPANPNFQFPFTIQNQNTKKSQNKNPWTKFQKSHNTPTQNQVRFRVPDNTTTTRVSEIPTTTITIQIRTKTVKRKEQQPLDLRLATDPKQQRGSESISSCYSFVRQRFSKSKPRSRSMSSFLLKTNHGSVKGRRRGRFCCKKFKKQKKLEVSGAAAPPWWFTGHRAGNIITHRRRWMFIFSDASIPPVSRFMCREKEENLSLERERRVWNE